ncbi:MAG: hypothetical protein IJ475_02070 [Bacilli bacterium]|nr:hypothetical protein [Bacilli bacterium]
MNLDDILEKIKRLDNGGNGTNMVCFIVAFDLLYFLKDNDNRERFIHEYYKNDNGMFTSNFKKICFYAESILLEDDIYANMLKSIEMDVVREDLVSLYNYYDAIDRIEKANISTKNMISDGFKIRLLKNVFDRSNEEFVKLDSNVRELKSRYDRNILDIVTIIAIFIAITVGMVSGISFSLQAFESLANNNFVTVSSVVLVVGFVIFNLFYALFKFVSKLCGKELDKNWFVVYIDVVFVSLIAFFVFLAI